LVLTEVVEVISGGNLIAMLVLVALMSLVLGLGLPTTANYIIVATLMAPIVVELGAQAGLIVPLIAIHLVVFYFGLLADVPPPWASPRSPRRRSRAAIRSAPASPVSSTACARSPCRSSSCSTPTFC